MELPKINTAKINLSITSLKIPIVSGVLIILIYILIVPQLKKIIDTKTTINNGNAELVTLESKELELRQLENYYKKNADQITKIKQSIPKTRETSDFVNQIETLAINNSLTIKDFKFPEAKKSSKTSEDPNSKTQTPTTQSQTKTQTSEDKSNEINFEIVVIGNFNPTNTFIESLEKLIRFTDIRSISIKTDNGIPETTLKGAILIQK